MSVNTKVNGQLIKSAGLYTVAKPIGMADIYSTEEREVGVWHNGKTIYQRTFIFDNAILCSSQSWTTLTETDATNVEEIITATAQDTIGTRFDPLGCNVQNGKFGVLQTRNNTIAIAKFTVQYTKTTDTPSSIYVPTGGGTDLKTTLAEMGITATFVGDYSEMYNDFNHIVRLTDTTNGQGLYFTNSSHYADTDLSLTIGVWAKKGMIQIGYGTGTLPTMITEGTGRLQFKNIPAGGFDTIAIPYGNVGFIGKFYRSSDPIECIFEIGI